MTGSELNTALQDDRFLLLESVERQRLRRTKAPIAVGSMALVLILVMAAVFLYRASSTLVLAMMFLTIGIKLSLEWVFPDTAYFNITALTIVIGFVIVATESWIRTRRGIHLRDIWFVESRQVGVMGLLLLASMVFLQVWFH